MMNTKNESGDRHLYIICNKYIKGGIGYIMYYTCILGEGGRTDTDNLASGQTNERKDVRMGGHKKLHI